jgi:hypothetical protein
MLDSLKGFLRSGGTRRGGSRSPPGLAAPVFDPASGKSVYPGPSLGIEAIGWENGGTPPSALTYRLETAPVPQSIEGPQSFSARSLSWRSRAHGPLVASSPDVAGQVYSPPKQLSFSNRSHAADVENFASITGAAQHQHHHHYQQQQIEQQHQIQQQHQQHRPQQEQEQEQEQQEHQQQIEQQQQIQKVPGEELPVHKVDSGQISAAPGYEATAGEEGNGLERDFPPR